MAFDISIENYQAFVTGLDQTQDEFERDVDALIQKASQTGQSKAVTVVPVRSGHLQDSITYSPGYLMSGFHTDVYYSAFVEFGHKTRGGKSFVPAQPYMIPAYEDAKDQLLDDIRAL